MNGRRAPRRRSTESAQNFPRLLRALGASAPAPGGLCLGRFKGRPAWRQGAGQDDLWSSLQGVVCSDSVSPTGWNQRVQAGWLAGEWVGARVGSEVLLEEKLAGANRTLRDLRNGGAVQDDPASRERGFSQCPGQVRKSGLLSQGGRRA